MEGWKDGRMEGWKGGRVEGWKGGRVECRGDGVVVGGNRSCDGGICELPDHPSLLLSFRAHLYA